jgi:hypothetical protein
MSITNNNLKFALQICKTMYLVIYIFLICFDIIIKCIWFNFQGQSTMKLEQDFF